MLWVFVFNILFLLTQTCEITTLKVRNHIFHAYTTNAKLVYALFITINEDISLSGSLSDLYQNGLEQCQTFLSIFQNMAIVASFELCFQHVVRKHDSGKDLDWLVLSCALSITSNRGYSQHFNLAIDMTFRMIKQWNKALCLQETEF